MATKHLFISHNTQFKEYRRAGLVLYNESQPFEVTDEQIAILKNDPRIEMHEVITKDNAHDKTRIIQDEYRVRRAQYS
jgi:hypothetical protein